MKGAKSAMLGRAAQGLALCVILVGPAAAADDAFDIVPSLGKTEPITLVGTDGAGQIGVAFVFLPDRSATAYVCDGKKIAVWFAGSLTKGEDKASLKTESGDTFAADWSGDRDITGEATVSGAKITFALQPAVRGRLKRDVTRVEGESQVAGWIFTNQGAFFGARVRNGKVSQATAGRVAAPAANESKLVVSACCGSSSYAQPQAMEKLHGSIVAKRLEARAAQVVKEGGQVSDDAECQRLLQKGKELGSTEPVFLLLGN